MFCENLFQGHLGYHVFFFVHGHMHSHFQILYSNIYKFLDLLDSVESVKGIKNNMSSHNFIHKMYGGKGP